MEWIVDDCILIDQYSIYPIDIHDFLNISFTYFSFLDNFDECFSLLKKINFLPKEKTTEEVLRAINTMRGIHQSVCNLLPDVILAACMSIEYKYNEARQRLVRNGEKNFQSCMLMNSM